MGVPVRLLWLPVIAVGLVGAAVAAQSRPPLDGSMGELVAEIRALRQAVERGTTLNARTQALLGRVQLQENRLADLGRRLDEARQRARAATAREASMTAQLASMAARLEHLPAGSDERLHVEQALRASRLELESAQREAAAQRADEQDLQAALLAEQSRWSEFNARLEAIEQDFARGARQP
jgi:chromosome segregation ATPase